MTRELNKALGWRSGGKGGIFTFGRSKDDPYCDDVHQISTGSISSP
jgi:hypothetical protein